MAKVQVTLTLDLAHPLRDIGRMNLRKHVEGAVERWGGCLHPDDFLFDGIVEAKAGAVKEMS